MGWGKEIRGSVGGSAAPGEGGLPFKPKLPSKLSQARSRLGEPWGGPGALLRAWVAGWQMAGELGTGEQGRARTVFQPRQL